MSAAIPASHLDLVTSKVAFAHLGTLMKDGRPQVTPIWFSWDGARIVLNSARGRVKDRNMRARPQVALSIIDPDNPYRYLQVMGTITEITEAGGDAHIDSLAHKYLGKDKYPWRAPGEVRVLYKVTPDQVQVMG